MKWEMGRMKKLYIFAGVVLTAVLVIGVKKKYNSHFVTNLKAYRDNLDYIKNEVNVQKDVWSGGSNKGKMDIFYDKAGIQNLKPVVFFVHGGGWIIGDKHEYSKIGSLLMKENNVAILPNYVLFPEGSFDDMVDDIYKSIVWTYNNIEKYGGDKNRLTLIGYSSGAHLTMLTILKSHLRMLNNGLQLSQLPRFEKVVLMNGPYDFDDYDTITNYILGTTKTSKIESGFVENLVKLLINSDEAGPTDILKKLKDNSIKDFGTPKFTFFYSDADTLIHQSSAENLIEQLHRVSPQTSINYVFSKGQNYEHYNLTLGARTNDKEKEKMFLDIVNL